MTDQTTPATDGAALPSRADLARALTGHSIDSGVQESGKHCTCGSDSRFIQSGGDDPEWTTIGEHRADMVLAASRAAARTSASRGPAEIPAPADRETVAQAIYESDPMLSPNWGGLSEYERDIYLRRADQVLAAFARGTVPPVGGTGAATSTQDQPDGRVRPLVARRQVARMLHAIDRAHAGCLAGEGCWSVAGYFTDQADALLADGAFTDADAIADNERLVQVICATPGVPGNAQLVVPVLRALPAALAECAR